MHLSLPTHFSEVYYLTVISSKCSVVAASGMQCCDSEVYIECIIVTVVRCSVWGICVGGGCMGKRNLFHKLILPT